MESYLPELMATLEPQQRLLAALEKRIEIINSDNYSKSEFEKNEVVITTIKTQAEIDTIKHVLKEKIEYFEKFVKKFDVEYHEMELKYEMVYKNARLLMAKKPTLKRFIETSKIKEIEKDKEAKLYFYKRLKELMQ